VTPLQRLVCAHRLTTEPDEMGDAICLACGGCVTVRLTLGGLDRFRRSVLSSGRAW
jgi:hypothetical protein